MTVQPLVSVYITNYNYGQFIREAIESVLQQTMQNFELFIIDDGSTDDSHLIIDEYSQHDKIQIIYQKNKGLNVTNNIAIGVSNGKYIVRLDADDYLESDALEKMSNVLESDDNIGLVFPDYYHVDVDGNRLERISRHNFDKEVSLFDQAAHGACTLIRVSYLKALGGYSEAYNCQDGYELWVKFTKKHIVRNINIPLFNYRQHGNNLTTNENRILDTRAKINADFINDMNIDNTSLAIIPVRSHKDKLLKISIDGTSLLNIKIKQALESDALKDVVIASEDPKIKELIQPIFWENEKLKFFLRSEKSARLNSTLDLTVMEIIESKILKHKNFQSIVLLDIKLPLIGTLKINDAINTLHLFGSNSLVSVRPDNSLFYKHYGEGLKPILEQDSFNKFERDILFRHVGGLTVVRTKTFQQKKKIHTQKIGHIILDKQSTYKIENDQDVEVVSILNRISKKF